MYSIFRIKLRKKEISIFIYPMPGIATELEHKG